MGRNHCTPNSLFDCESAEDIGSFIYLVDWRGLLRSNTAVFSSKYGRWPDNLLLAPLVFSSTTARAEPNEATFRALFIEAMNTDFGNTFTEVRSVSVFGLILSTIVAVLFICIGYTHGTLSTCWPQVVVITLAIGVVVPLAVLLTSLFSIRLDEQRVAHLFLRRFVLGERPLSELVGADFFRGTFPVVFRFSDGSHIRFIGAHVGIVSALRRRLFELRPDLQS